MHCFTDNMQWFTSNIRTWITLIDVKVIAQDSKAVLPKLRRRLKIPYRLFHNIYNTTIPPNPIYITSGVTVKSTKVVCLPGSGVSGQWHRVVVLQNMQQRSPLIKNPVDILTTRCCSEDSNDWHLLHHTFSEFRIAHVQILNRISYVIISINNANWKHDWW